MKNISRASDDLMDILGGMVTLLYSLISLSLHFILTFEA